MALNRWTEINGYTKSHFNDSEALQSNRAGANWGAESDYDHVTY